MIVTVASAKGGVGKTTCAVALAEASVARFGSCFLADLDRQGSAVLWREMAEAAGEPLRARVATFPVREGELRRRLGAVEEPAVILDVPPGDEVAIRAALAVADVTLVPTRAAVGDVARVWATLELAQAAGVTALVILNMIRPGTVASSGALEALEANGYAPALQIPLREAIANDFGRRPGPILRELGDELLALVTRRSPRARRR